MKSRLIPILIAQLFAASTVSAADGDFAWSGSASIGLRGQKATASDGAKLKEYGDLGSLNQTTVIDNLDVKGRGNDYYLKFFGENVARDDQYLDLTGGKYGVFKYQLYDDRMPHNLSWNAITPLAGAGGANLTYGAAISTNPAAWKVFDYKLKRDSYGGNFELSNNSPWFIRFDGGEVTTTGVRPMSGPLGTGSSNGFMDLPTPVDYKTQNISVEGGYASKRGQFSVNLARSKFSNSIGQLNWQNPNFGNGMDANLLPPDNELTKISGNGVLRQLPMGSTLSGRFSYSRLTDSFTVQTTNLRTAGGFTTSMPNSPVFNGKNETYTTSLALTSNLTRQLDSKVYWNWYNKNNSSTAISYLAGFGTGGATGALAAPQLFGYKKNNLGIDLSYRFNAQHKLSGGYEYLDVDRALIASTNTRDNKVYAEYRNNSLDILSARFKYQYTERRSNFYPNGGAPVITNIGNPTWMTPFDVANVNQDLVKVVVDVSPAPLLDLGLEAIYKKNDYTDRPYGATKDTRAELSGQVSYGDPNVFRVTAFGDAEYIVYDQFYRTSCTAIAGSGCSPSAAQSGATNATTGNQFNWGSKTKDNSYLIGLGADWTATERFALKGSYIWSKTTGGVDFSSTNNWGPTLGGVNLGPLIPYVTDNTTKHQVNLKGTYKANKSLDVTGGFAYERYDYHDDQMAGFNGVYANYMSMGATNNSYLSGAFSNPSYTARIYYLMATYKFQ